MPLVSVIIPAYNEESDIEECIKSLMKQSFKDFEIIVVDDGSTDKTISAASKFKKVKIFRQNHGGPGRARNLGARKAKWRILVLIDADMHFDKDYIKNLIKPITGDKTGKIIGTTHEHEIATNLKSPWSRMYGEIRVSKENAREVRIFRAIRKDKFLELGGFDPKYGYADDQTFWYKYNIKPMVAKNTTCYHKNPETLRATYGQARWIGKSWKKRFKIFSMPIINYLAVLGLYVLYMPLFIARALITRVEGITLKQKLVYYMVKFIGYINGVAEAVFLNRVWR
ncbi:glycosyltransferase family 2 protein [Candidatus Pacearchaeota archaeon]|nr:glycosyltransferase family 2 protein [Candidatus Pacearchaeota archaeon]